MGTDIKINNKIIFYDGFCVVCSRFINLIIKSDKKKQTKFTSISSKYSIKILEERLGSGKIGKFIVYLSNNKIYTKSDAVIQVFIELEVFIIYFQYLKYFPSFRNKF